MGLLACLVIEHREGKVQLGGFPAVDMCYGACGAVCIHCHGQMEWCPLY